jgi:hypothetical protein
MLVIPGETRSKNKTRQTYLYRLQIVIWKFHSLGNGIFVTKLTCTKINLINQNRENTKNNLIAVNMNNTSTTQIKINSCRTIQARQPNNRSKHWITIARNKRKIWGFTYSGSCENEEMEPSVKKSASGRVSALPRNLIRRHPCRSSDRRRRLGDTALPRSAARRTKER